VGLGGLVVPGTLSDSMVILNAIFNLDVATARTTGLGKPFAHYGRIFKTLHLLHLVDDVSACATGRPLLGSRGWGECAFGPSSYARGCGKAPPSALPSRTGAQAGRLGPAPSPRCCRRCSQTRKAARNGQGNRRFVTAQSVQDRRETSIAAALRPAWVLVRQTPADRRGTPPPYATKWRRCRRRLASAPDGCRASPSFAVRPG